MHEQATKNTKKPYRLHALELVVGEKHATTAVVHIIQQEYQQRQEKNIFTAVQEIITMESLAGCFQ